jgi:hypothetical protein
MRLYRTTRGLARGEGDELLLLDLPHSDIGSLLADDVTLADIRATDAWNHVGGFTVANDVSARDIQFHGMHTTDPW